MPQTDDLDRVGVGATGIPGLRQHRLALSDQREQVAGEGERPTGGVAEDHHAVAGLDVDLEPREEPGHRPAVPRIPAPVDVPDLPAEAVPGQPRLAGQVVDRLDDAHLLEGVLREDVAGVAGEEGRPAGEVVHRRPQLPRGRHRAGVVLRLGEEQVGERMDGQPDGGPALRRRDVVRAMPSGSSRSRWTTSVHGDAFGPARPARPAPHTRRWCSGTGSPGRIRCTGDGAISAAQSPPGVRSHQGPSVSDCNPEVCVSSCAIVARPNAVPGTWSSSRSSRSSRPASRSRMTHTATNVLVIEPIRYCVSESAGTPSARPSSVPRASDQTSSPPRTIPAATDGSRTFRCSTASRVRERRARSTGRASPRGQALRADARAVAVDPVDRAAAVFFAVVFLAVDFGGLLRRPLAGRRALGPLLGEQLERRARA